jgi:hypothetical protein
LIPGQSTWVLFVDRTALGRVSIRMPRFSCVIILPSMPHTHNIHLYYQCRIVLFTAGSIIKNTSPFPTVFYHCVIQQRYLLYRIKYPWHIYWIYYPKARRSATISKLFLCRFLLGHIVTVRYLGKRVLLDHTVTPPY